ncbi:unnamed protein product [Prorocentrum cordatum]|uniref:Uncharacterized protein n=1 Tax=Prorocentrum cordatum TaxID=2364126 RepID=A0ABN9SZT7_9DINO|nr:unnamed protein product [Polarella glacialis]
MSSKTETSRERLKTMVAPDAWWCAALPIRSLNLFAGSPQRVHPTGARHRFCYIRRVDSSTSARTNQSTSHCSCHYNIPPTSIAPHVLQVRAPLSGARDRESEGTSPSA